MELRQLTAQQRPVPPRPLHEDLLPTTTMVSHFHLLRRHKIYRRQIRSNSESKRNKIWTRFDKPKHLEIVGDYLELCQDMRVEGTALLVYRIRRVEGVRCCRVGVCQREED